MTDTETILVVDDTHAALVLLTQILRQAGYRVLPADSSELALAAFAGSLPDLVLLDINMPDMDGYALCERLKRDERTRDVPVIFISALHETLDKVRAFGVGGVDYVAKPFAPEEVEARVRTHLELRRQRRELQLRCEALKKVESLRDNLVHMIVHDMRSPLTALSGGFELLREELAEAGARGPVEELLRLGEGATSDLVAMCSDLLDVNRLENGRLPLRREPCDLRALVASAVSATRVHAETRAVAVCVEGQAVQVEADGDLLGRVLVNLLSNAIKHSPANEEVLVRVNASESRARVEVSDKGCGIPSEYHGKIFEKYGLVEARQEGQKQAMGLGLAFSKLAVEAHAGRIGVESRSGHGSTFWMELPLAADASRAKEAI